MTAFDEMDAGLAGAGSTGSTVRPPYQAYKRWLDTIPADLLQKPGKLQIWLIGEHQLGRLKLRKDIPMVP